MAATGQAADWPGRNGVVASVVWNQTELETVDQIVIGSNPLISWLRQIEELRSAT